MVPIVVVRIFAGGGYSDFCDRDLHAFFAYNCVRSALDQQKEH